MKRVAFTLTLLATLAAASSAFAGGGCGGTNAGRNSGTNPTVNTANGPSTSVKAGGGGSPGAGVKR